MSRHPDPHDDDTQAGSVFRDQLAAFLGPYVRLGLVLFVLPTVLTGAVLLVVLVAALADNHPALAIGLGAVLLVALGGLALAYRHLRRRVVRWWRRADHAQGQADERPAAEP